jgi:PAS domain S-box-containing protein
MKNYSVIVDSESSKVEQVAQSNWFATDGVELSNDVLSLVEVTTKASFAFLVLHTSDDVVVYSNADNEHKFTPEKLFWQLLINREEEQFIVSDVAQETELSSFHSELNSAGVRSIVCLKLFSSAQKFYGMLCAMAPAVNAFSPEHLNVLQIVRRQLVRTLEDKSACAQYTELNEMYKNLIERAQEIICRTNAEGRVTFFNETSVRLLGYSREELMGKHYLEFYPLEFQDNIRNLYRTQRDKKLQDTYFECPILTKDGRTLWIGQNVSTLWNNDTLIGFQVVARDITEKRHGEELREQLIRQLEEAVYNVKTLSGLLPICASCKKIRDDGGYWNQVEAYLMDHTDLTLTHGICPECMKKLYPQYYKERVDVKTTT